LVGEAQWGTALPVDPGEHVFEAAAPGKKPWRQVVDLRGEGATIDVNVPALEDEAKPAVAATPAPAPAPAQPDAPPPGDDGGSQRTWALVLGGAGVIATGVGLGFGLSASSKWSEAEEACPNKRCTDPEKQKLGEDAGTAADVSTALVAF